MPSEKILEQKKAVVELSEDNQLQAAIEAMN